MRNPACPGPSGERPKGAEGSHSKSITPLEYVRSHDSDLNPFRSCSCALFHFPYTTFATLSSLPSIHSALFRKTWGVAWVSSHFGLPRLPERSRKRLLSPRIVPLKIALVLSAARLFPPVPV